MPPCIGFRPISINPAGSSVLAGEKWSAIGPWYSSFPLPDPLGQATARRRGGAWVVLDSKINAESIEMYADETSHAGVLEPSGPHPLPRVRWDG